jgi:hypothetical protein
MFIEPKPEEEEETIFGGRIAPLRSMDADRRKTGSAKATIAGSIATARGDYERWIGAIQPRAETQSAFNRITDKPRIDKVIHALRRTANESRTKVLSLFNKIAGLVAYREALRRMANEELGGGTETDKKSAQSAPLRCSRRGRGPCSSIALRLSLSHIRPRED